MERIVISGYFVQRRFFDEYVECMRIHSGSRGLRELSEPTVKILRYAHAQNPDPAKLRKLIDAVHASALTARIIGPRD